MAHREDIRAYLESLTVSGHVLDWGAGSKPVSKYVKHDEGTIFFEIDKNPQTNPDKVADIEEDVRFGSDQEYWDVDHAFCMEVLEHTTEPQVVLNNIYNNLKLGGVLHLSVPSVSYPEHGEEDYLRFSESGLRKLAEKASFKEIKIWGIEDGYLMEATK